MWRDRLLWKRRHSRTWSEAKQAIARIREALPPASRRERLLRRGLLAGKLLLAAIALGILLVAVLAFVYSRKAAGYAIEEVERIPAGSLVLGRDGRPIGRIHAKDRLLVKIEEVPVHVIAAVLATEDERFRSHRGYDPQGIMRAAVRNLQSGKVCEGGSSITQQLARQVFELRGRTLHRKLLELFLARRIEQNYGKDEILEHYLNRIYFGSGFWGVGAAARGYFGKAVEELSVEESALLAGIIRSPSRHSPFADPEQARRVRDTTLDRLAETKFLTPERARELRGRPLEVMSAQDRASQPGYLLSTIAQEARRILGPEAAEQGGLRIESTIDPGLQQGVMTALSARLDALESRADFTGPRYASYKRASDGPPGHLQGAALVVDHEDGSVLAYVGGRDFAHSQYCRGWQTARPSGTAFAPFVYAAAFETGSALPVSPVLDLPMNNRYVMVGGRGGVLGEWGAEDVTNRFDGRVTTAWALLWSKNAATVRVGLQTGLDQVRTTAKLAGIASPLRNYSSTFLGSSEVTLRELTNAYATFARNGVAAARPELIDRILDAEGMVLYERRQGQTERAIKARAAHRVHRILHESLKMGTAFQARAMLGLRNPHAAGKTGTTHDFTDNWFVGYDGRLACGAWIGYDKPRAIFPNAFSRLTALPLWVDCMNAAIDHGYAPQPVQAPGGADLVSVCLQSGLRAGPFCQQPGPDGATLSCAMELDLGARGGALPPCHEHDEGRPPADSVARAVVVGGEGEVALGRPVVPRGPHVVGPNPFLPGFKAEDPGQPPHRTDQPKHSTPEP